MTKRFFYCMLILFSLLAVSCTSDEMKQKVMNERINMPLEVGKNIYITYTDSGYLKAKIFAPRLERYSNEEQSETIMPKGITAYFYSHQKTIDSYLKSKYAIRYDREKKMIARND